MRGQDVPRQRPVRRVQQLPQLRLLPGRDGGAAGGVETNRAWVGSARAIHTEGQGAVMSRPTAVERFWAKVQKTPTCWLWTGARTNKGYGRFWNGQRYVYSHRWVYEQSFGAIPAGLTIDHLCRTRRCVRPNHLQPVTNRQNILRGSSPPAQNARKTHCPLGHVLADPNLYTNPKTGKRQCRECKLRSQYEQRRRHPLRS